MKQKIFEIIYTIYKDGEVYGASNKFTTTDDLVNALAEKINNTVLDIPELPYKITFKVDSINAVELIESIEDINNF